MMARKGEQLCAVKVLRKGHLLQRGAKMVTQAVAEKQVLQVALTLH